MKEKAVFFIGLGKIGMDTFKKMEVFSITRKWEIYGFEIDQDLIDQDQTGKIFHLNEINKFQKKIQKDIIYIFSLPTNINKFKKPDTRPFDSVSDIIKENIKETDIMINQSTVYPGFTYEYGNKCGFKNIFMIPERFDETNPTLNFERILGSNLDLSKKDSKKLIDFIIDIYIRLGFDIKKITNLENAETSKLLENIQRDVNIALINEFDENISQINKNLSLNLNMKEILDCASTKRNFYKVKPGLVGGHCIPMDPYWFLSTLDKAGGDSKLIKEAREINEEKIQKKYYEIIEDILKNDYQNILIYGITYKKGSDDYRYSPNYQILKKIVKLNNKNIYIYDNDLKDEEINKIAKELASTNFNQLKDKTKIDKIYYLKIKEG